VISLALTSVARARTTDTEWKTFPADPTVVEATSASGAAVSYSVPIAVIKSAKATVTCLPAPGTVLPLGQTEAVCTAVADGRPPAVRSFKIVVRDTTAPTISGADDVTRTASGQSTQVDYTLPKASDLVSGSVPVSCKPAPGAAFPVGSTTVECTATDKAGNKATASFKVVLAPDQAPPAIDKPGDVAVEAQGQTTRVEYAPPAASDSVDGTVQTACSPPSGSSFPVGRTTVTCKAADAAGNTSSAQFDVVVADTTPPELTVPAPLRVSTSSSDGMARSNTAIAAFLAGATATDRVDGSLPTTSEAPSILPIGSTNVVFSAVDRAGNRARKEVVVTVELVKSAVAAPAPAPAAPSPPPPAAVRATNEPPVEPRTPSAPAKPAAKGGESAPRPAFKPPAEQPAAPARARPASARPDSPASDRERSGEQKRPAAPAKQTARPSRESKRADARTASDLTPSPETLGRLLKKSGSPIPLIVMACILLVLLALLVWSAVRGVRAAPPDAPGEPVSLEREPVPIAARVPEAPAETAPLPDPAAAVDPLECEIALWQGYRKWQFYARALNEEGKELMLGESPAFRLGSAEDAEAGPPVLAAHEELLRRLQADGWKVTGANGTWYSLRLRRVRS
jgi:HYR domain-containing protein